MIRQYILPSLALAAPAAAEAATDGAALPSDLSVWGMFAQADWVVKLVMLGLVVASIVTWTVLVAKHPELARQRKDAEAFRDRLAAAALLAADGFERFLDEILLVWFVDALRLWGLRNGLEI